MSDQKIDVHVTDTDKILSVVVYHMKPEKIEVVLGEGIHSVKCELLPTSNGSAYAGSAMGREIVYERSTAQVKSDIDAASSDYRNSRRC